ncbi:MAG TPA: HTTM domain-containing protein [Kofleriaceae bacterium]|nr:HTTM domain-containing protein [Kofleriaceae bacterium]
MSARGKRARVRVTASSPASARRGFAAGWNDLFFATRDPRLASVLRIGYGALLLINLAVLAPDVGLWFSDAGLLPAADAREVVNEHAITVLGWVGAAWWPWLCYGVVVAAAALLTVGWHTRVQAVIVLIGLTSLQDRNYLIVDGEDTLFRLFAFYLALCPAGWAYSLDARRRRRRGTAEPRDATRGPLSIDPPPIPWALRLFQIQISVVYLSSAIEKTLGHDWVAGTALYYVSRLDDAFGKFPLPGFVFETLWLTRLLSWSVLALEWTLPVLLWLPRTRRIAIVVAIGFHLAVEYSMNLFLFHWLMILGVLSFAEFAELRWPPWRRPAPAAA